jgi:hypothetical protein
MPVFLSRAFVVAAAVSMVSAVEIKLNWVIRTYNPMTATVGDEAVFTWPGDHNVYVHPSGDCTEVRYFKILNACLVAVTAQSLSVLRTISLQNHQHIIGPTTEAGNEPFAGREG